MTYIVNEERVVKLWTYLYHERLRLLADPLAKEVSLNDEMAADLRESYGPGTMVIRKPGILELIVF